MVNFSLISESSMLWSHLYCGIEIVLGHFFMVCLNLLLLVGSVLILTEVLAFLSRVIHTLFKWYTVLYQL